MNYPPKFQKKQPLWELMDRRSLPRNKWIAYAALLLLLVSCAKSGGKTKTVKTPKKSAAAATLTVKTPKKPVAAATLPPVQDPNQLVWAWQPEALHLSITADRDLNRYNEQPHALMLCLYQLSSVNGWSELIKNPGGVETLLKCEGFDPSVVQSERLFIQPGEQQQFDLDRLENGRYVTLVAGYAAPKARRLSRIFKFPVKHATKGLLFWKKQLYWPGELSLNLVLTEQSLQSSESP